MKRDKMDWIKWLWFFGSIIVSFGTFYLAELLFKTPPNLIFYLTLNWFYWMYKAIKAERIDINS